jgi:hypothetical protein
MDGGVGERSDRGSEFLPPAPILETLNAGALDVSHTDREMPMIEGSMLAHRQQGRKLGYMRSLRGGFTTEQCLFYFGKPKLGGFALIISQTFVGGDIGYRKTDELQRLPYVSDLRIIHDFVQCLG